uniref:CST complex subunit TEN1 n=1 Tax=Nippostrongylus brasiliensis TaxID=27835 RepID=A0A0N4XRG4_NIPBR
LHTFITVKLFNCQFLVTRLDLEFHDSFTNSYPYNRLDSVEQILRSDQSQQVNYLNLVGCETHSDCHYLCIGSVVVLCRSFIVTKHSLFYERMRAYTIYTNGTVRRQTSSDGHCLADDTHCWSTRAILDREWEDPENDEVVVQEQELSKQD